MRWLAPALLLLTGSPPDLWGEAAAFYQKFSGSRDPKERTEAAEKLQAGMDGKHDKQATQWLILMIAGEIGRDQTGGKKEEMIVGQVLLAAEETLKKATTADAIDTVIDQAKRHAVPRVRFHLCRALGGYKASAPAAKALIELVDDKSPLVVIGAADGMFFKGDPATLDTLLKLVKRPDLPWEAMLSAIDAFGSINQPERCMDGLLELLTLIPSDEGRLKVELIEVLGKLCGVQDPVCDDINFWKSAWADKKAGRRPGEGRNTTTEPTAFFGLKTRSTRIVFALDRTGSMEQTFTPPTLDAALPSGSPAPSDAPRKKLSADEENARARCLESRKKWDAFVVKKKMDGLKRELVRTIVDLDAQVWFTVIWYEGNTLPWKPTLVPATWTNKFNCLTEIEKIHPSGPTNIWDGLETAFKFIEGLSKNKGPIGLDRKTNYATSVGGADTIFLMTDGIHNMGKFVTNDQPPKPDGYAFIGELKKIYCLRKITVHAVALGDVKVADKANPMEEFTEDALKFLQDIAEATGGTFKHIGARAK